MTPYRAAYYVTPDGQQSTVMTRPEHAHLSDDELRTEALAEAQRGDIVDMERTDAEAAFPRLTRDDFDAGLHIGEWRE